MSHCRFVLCSHWEQMVPPSLRQGVADHRRLELGGMPRVVPNHQLQVLLSSVWQSHQPQVLMSSVKLRLQRPLIHPEFHHQRRRRLLHVPHHLGQTMPRAQHLGPRVAFGGDGVPGVPAQHPVPVRLGGIEEVGFRLAGDEGPDGKNEGDHEASLQRCVSARAGRGVF